MDDSQRRQYLDDAQNELSEYIKKIYKNWEILPLFAYYLRISDDKSDTYTKKFLSDMQPEFLYKVILANQWDQTK